jgi:hypothetical protein
MVVRIFRMTIVTVGGGLAGGGWWQVMVCGGNVPGVKITSFSNVISFGAVPV